MLETLSRVCCYLLLYCFEDHVRDNSSDGTEGWNMKVRSERQNLNYCIFEGQEVNMTARELRLTEERKH